MSYDVSAYGSNFTEDGSHRSSSVPPDAIRADVGAGQAAISRGDRITAAIIYLGLLPLLIVASQPGTRFVRRHQRCALAVQLLRVLLIGVLLLVWRGSNGTGGTLHGIGETARDIGMLVAVGNPWHSTFTTGALPWMITPLALTWALALAGLVLAIAGRSADFRAFVSADWSETPVRRRWLYHTPEEERVRARRARERQLERLEKSTQLIRSERTRNDQITEINDQIERLNAQREYYDQLLALGEISQRRYDTANQELDDQISEFRGRLAGLTTRVALSSNHVPGRLRVNRLERPTETGVESLAIVTTSGVPIFTYGQFLLDEALVAGILSAFDSLSEEVFGSRVHKTWLDQGQVLYFARGEHVVIMAIFEDEPAPRQVEQLRNMIQQFEQANEGPLLRQQHDPEYLHQVAIPFRFVGDRSSR